MIPRLMRVLSSTNYGNSAIRRVLPLSSNRYAEHLNRSTSIVDSYKFSTRPEIALKNKSFQDFYDKIKTGYRNNGVVNSDIFTLAVDNISENVEPTEEQSLFLLESCGFYLPTKTQSERIVLFKKIWKYLKSLNLLTKQHFIIGLTALRENKAAVSDLQDFLNDCYAFSDHLEIYEGIIALCCASGNIKLASDILIKMKEKNFPVTENIFNSLIVGHSKCKDLDSCQSVLETMSATNMEPSIETKKCLLNAYIANNAAEKANKILQSTGNLFNAAQVLSIVRTCIEHDNKYILEESIKVLHKDFVQLNDIPAIFRTLCTELIYSGRLDESLFVIKCFPKPNFKVNEDIDSFCAFLLYHLVLSKTEPDKVIKICAEIIETERNTRALHCACEIALRRVPDIAIYYLEALSTKEQLRPQYFWPLLLFNFRKNGEIGVLNTVRKMCELNVECDNETISSYIIPRLSITLEDTQKAIKSLEKCGLKTTQILTPIICQMIFRQKYNEIIKICELYHTKLDTEQFVQPIVNIAINLNATKSFQSLAQVVNKLQLKSSATNFDLTGQILLEMISNSKIKNDFETLNKFFQELRQIGVKISRTASDIIIAHYAKFENNKFAKSSIEILNKLTDNKLNVSSAEMFGTHIVHPRDMTSEELECHLVELETKGLNTRGLLRRLLQLCVRENKIQRAIEVRQKCIDLKVDLSPGMMASLFDLNIKIKNVEEAEIDYKNIKTKYPNFLLDEHKVIDFAALLVEKNRLEDAKKLLKQRASSSKLKAGEYIHKNLWQLLINVATHSANTPQDSASNSSRDFFNFLHNLGYCSYHNTLLGPIIKEYILRHDIKSAVEEYKRICEEYKKTPLQLELITLLVKLSNGIDTEIFHIPSTEAKELLQTVTTLTASVHGSANANSSLLIAFAESGTENQLRKVLIDPNFLFNQDMLIKNCEHLSHLGKTSSILKLAKASRGLGYNFKEQDLYDMLLDSFSKENNFSAAVELFNKLESDDDFKISPNFLKVLINLLNINKIDIPSNIALRSKLF